MATTATFLFQAFLPSLELETEMARHVCDGCLKEGHMFLYVPESRQWDVYVDFDIAGMTSNVRAGTAKHCLHCGARLKADGTVGDPNRPFGSYMPFNIGATVDVRRTATVEVAETGQSVRIDPGCYELLMREVPQWGQEGGDE